jgi:hypothetical protein
MNSKCYLNYAKCINIQPQTNKKIISFSLYGTTSQFSNSRGFYKGIYVNYHLAKKLYPDWDGHEQMRAFISDENTIIVIHGSEHYHFTRVH